MGEVSTYAIDLRSMTQSRGTFTLHFVRYEDCPPAAQRRRSQRPRPGTRNKINQCGRGSDRFPGRCICVG